jgi:hypothetical protein
MIRLDMVYLKPRSGPTLRTTLPALMEHVGPDETPVPGTHKGLKGHRLKSGNDFGMLAQFEEHYQTRILSNGTGCEF